jgi:hypothetical protein
MFFNGLAGRFGREATTAACPGETVVTLTRVDRWTVLIGLLVIVWIAAVAYWRSTNEVSSRYARQNQR